MVNDVEHASRSLPVELFAPDDRPGGICMTEATSPDATPRASSVIHVVAGRVQNAFCELEVFGAPNCFLGQNLNRNLHKY